MYEGEKYEGEKTVSEFNEATFQIYRLHQIWQECRRTRESGDLDSWKWKLDSAETELDYDIKKIDEDKNREYRKKINQLNKKIDEIGKRFRKTQNLDYLSILYSCLKKKMNLLKEVQNESGKGGRYRPPEDDYM